MGKIDHYSAEVPSAPGKRLSEEMIVEYFALIAGAVNVMPAPDATNLRHVVRELERLPTREELDLMLRVWTREFQKWRQLCDVAAASTGGL